MSVQKHVDREFDIIVFGATGYTGKYVIEELARATEEKLKNKFTKSWAIAGRNIDKLQASLESVQQYLEDIDITKIPIIKADVGDPQSIIDMCKRTRLILNCVGPYKYYGEIVVANCVKYGTHHVDISGEIKYLETTQVKYFNDARKNCAYIVQACGFDSIPAELGVAMLKKKFPGDLNSVKIYVEILHGSEGCSTNIGTWLSAVYSAVDVLNASYYTKLLKEIFPKPLPYGQFLLGWPAPISNFSCSENMKGWCIMFPGPDERVIKRTQMFCYQFENERPVQVQTFLKMKSFFSALCYIFFFAIFGAFALFPPGRYLLSKFPSFFTYGFFTKSGPSRKQVETCSSRWALCGEGWSEKLAEPTDQHVTKPNTKRILTITGPEAAYALTSICMVHAGMVILDEADKMPFNGGVLTPGAAFTKTTLMERLKKRGISFKFE